MMSSESGNMYPIGEPTFGKAITFPMKLLTVFIITLCVSKPDSI